MNSKIILTFCVVLFISLAAFSQEQQESLHPKLDKYYQTNDPPAPVTKPSSTVIPNTTAPAPVATGTVNKVAAPQSTVTVKVDTTAAETIIQNQPMPEPVPEPVTVQTPPPPPVQLITPPSQPDPGSLYSETRLGSSTPQYDTYETNSNGAGSVTTTPK